MLTNITVRNMSTVNIPVVNVVYSCIIVISVPQEDGKKKCHRYFPEDSNRSSHIDFEQVCKL